MTNEREAKPTEYWPPGIVSKLRAEAQKSLSRGSGASLYMVVAPETMLILLDLLAAPEPKAPS